MVKGFDDKTHTADISSTTGDVRSVQFLGYDQNLLTHVGHLLNEDIVFLGRFPSTSTKNIRQVR